MNTNSRSGLAALRLTWGVMLAGVVASCMWLALGILVEWQRYRDVVGPVLRGEPLTVPGMDPSGQPYVFSAGPRWVLIATIAALACAAIAGTHAWLARTQRLFVVRTALLAALALAIVVFSVWWLPPSPSLPAVDSSPGLERAAVRFAAIVDAWTLS
ncbi:MAG: hypothetical protein ACXVEF_43425, partial [Polyangiales bacterium]